MSASDSDVSGLCLVVALGEESCVVGIVTAPRLGNFNNALGIVSPTCVSCIALPTCFIMVLAERAAGADDARHLENMHGVPALATCSSVIGKPDIVRPSVAVTSVVE